MQGQPTAHKTTEFSSSRRHQSVLMGLSLPSEFGVAPATGTGYLLVKQAVQYVLDDVFAESTAFIIPSADRYANEV